MSDRLKLVLAFMAVVAVVALAAVLAPNTSSSTESVELVECLRSHAVGVQVDSAVLGPLASQPSALGYLVDLSRGKQADVALLPTVAKARELADGFVGLGARSYQNVVWDFNRAPGHDAARAIRDCAVSAVDAAGRIAQGTPTR